MRVLCINGSFDRMRPSFKYIKELPKEMEVYTVKEIVTVRSVTGYILNEVDGGKILIGPNKYKEVSFDSNRFVLLSESEDLEEIELEESHSTGCLI